MRLEHPLLAALHEALVLRGDWDRSEALLDEILAAGLLDEWDGTAGGTKGQTVAKWDRIGPSEQQEEEELEADPSSSSPTWPRGRGGHAMVRVGRRVLLYGGWDGKRELGDMWEFDLPLNASDVGPGSSSGKWRCLDDGTSSSSSSTNVERKPGPRSCHQMVVDERDGWVYVLGARRDELDDEGHDDDDEEDRGGDVARRDAELLANIIAGDGESSRDAAGMDVDENGGGGGNGVQNAAAAAATRAAPATRENKWKSDFWRYKAAGPDRGKWELLSEDTRRDGGPALLYVAFSYFFFPLSRPSVSPYRLTLTVLSPLCRVALITRW